MDSLYIPREVAQAFRYASNKEVVREICHFQGRRTTKSQSCRICSKPKPAQASYQMYILEWLMKATLQKLVVDRVY